MTTQIVAGVGVVLAAIAWRLIAKPVPRPIARSASVVELTECLDEAARQVHGGRSLRVALGTSLNEIGPGAAILAGAPLTEQLERWAVSAATHHERMAAAALMLAAEAGGRQAQAIDAASTNLRTLAARRGEIATHTAQAKLSAIVIAALPVGFAVISGGASRSAMGSPLGAISFGAGLVLDGLGAWWLPRSSRRVR